MSANVYVPVWKRAPNKFLRYELKDLDDGAGNVGHIRVAIYMDKNGNQKSETAQVIWNRSKP